MIEDNEDSIVSKSALKTYTYSVFVRDRRTDKDHRETTTIESPSQDASLIVLRAWADKHNYFILNYTLIR